MILIPYPSSANNHQKHNALELVQKNAAELIEQKDMNQKLINTIEHLLINDIYREEMGNNANKLHEPNSLNLIIESIKECLYV